MSALGPTSTVSAPALPARLRVESMGKLCVAIQAGSPSELIERAEAALVESQPDARFIELRLDSLPKPASALPKIKELLAAHREVTAIATCRRKEFGGSFDGPL